MTTGLDDGPEEFGPDDPLAVILRPSSDYLGPPAGRYEAVRRAAVRRRLLRTAAGAGLVCAVAALVVVPLRLAAPDTPTTPTVPLAPPSVRPSAPASERPTAPPDEPPASATRTPPPATDASVVPTPEASRPVPTEAPDQPATEPTVPRDGRVAEPESTTRQQSPSTAR